MYFHESMFLRTTKAKSHHYVCIVKAYRDAQGKPKQKVIQNLGAFKTEEEREKLYCLGRNLLKSMQGESLFSRHDLRELRRENWGAAALMDRLFEVYQLTPCFEALTADRKIEYNLVTALKFMLATRFIAPMSKLAAFQQREYFSGFGPFELQHLYRSLDELHRYQDAIKTHLFQRQKALSRQPMDVVFFDVTTLYFESQQPDGLREFGFSKDCKFNETQVVLSLLITRDGRPIGYELFPGNQYEGSTLLRCLVQLRERYQIQQVVIVADRGLSSFQNLQAIKDQGFQYIIASRWGHLSAALQEDLLDCTDYRPLHVGDEEDDVRYKTLSFERRKRLKNDAGTTETQCLSEQLLGLYSHQRAKKDAYDRERLVQKATEILASGRCDNKRGAKQYLKIVQARPEALDLEKIAKASRYDGFYLISYSDPSLEPADVAATYRGLWKIEASFRSMKHFFETRPLFHWNPQRISGHILLNFLCLIFQRFIEQTLATTAAGHLSEQAIRTALKGLERSIVDIQGTQTCLYAATTPHQSILLQALHLKKPL